jgi:two-component system response regulator ChvI
MTAPSRTVAIVEDEDGIRESVLFALGREGHAATGYADGRRAWAAFEAALPDLAILDIGLPGMDGLELCRRLRSRSEALPIVFLTSREEEFDRVLGLEIGADDYLCKPFSMRELMARVEALARRPGHVKSRDQLLEAAYPHDTSASDRTIDSHVKRLRRKFQDVDPDFDAIESVYGAGYRLRAGDR